MTARQNKLDCALQVLSSHSYKYKLGQVYSYCVGQNKTLHSGRIWVR